MTYAHISALLLIQRVHLQKYSEEDILIEYKDESWKQIQCKGSRLGGDYHAIR